MSTVTEGQSTVNVCLWRLHGRVLDFIHLSATVVAEIAEPTHLKGVSTYSVSPHFCIEVYLFSVVAPYTQ